MLKVVALGSAIIMAYACEPGSSEDQPSPPDEASTAQVPLPTVQHLVQYGCMACSGAELFGSIAAVAAASTNSFAVVTREAPHVRLWDLDSGVVTQFGAAGAGPGEFVRPIGVALLGDSLMVAESRASLGSKVYSTDGTHHGSASPYSTSGLATVASYTSSPSGNWLLQIENLPGNVARILRINIASGAPDIIDVPSYLFEEHPVPGAVSPALISGAVSDSGMVALGHGGVDYRLVLISSDGAPHALGGRGFPRRPYSSEEVEEFRERLAARPNIPPEVVSQWPPPNVAFYHPHFSQRALNFDAHGRLWVRTARGSEVRTIFDLFNSDLDHLGEVDIDYQIFYYHIGSRLLVGSMSGNLGVSFVNVWGILDP